MSWNCPLCFAENTPKPVKDDIKNAPDVQAALDFVEMFAKDYQESSKHWEDKMGPPLPDIPDCATQWRWIGDLTTAPVGASDFLFGEAHGSQLDVGLIKHGKALLGSAAGESLVGGLAEALCGYPAMTRRPRGQP